MSRQLSRRSTASLALERLEDRTLLDAGFLDPTFGTGVVRTVPGPGKVEIVFPLPAGARVMACGKEVSTLARPVAVAGVPVADRPPGK